MGRGSFSYKRTQSTQRNDPRKRGHEHRYDDVHGKEFFGEMRRELAENCIFLNNKDLPNPWLIAFFLVWVRVDSPSRKSNFLMESPPPACLPYFSSMTR